MRQMWLRQPFGKKFCGDCGASLGNCCPKCGVENPESKKFCGDCGTVLDAGSSTSAGSKSLSRTAPATSGISIAAEQTSE
jgi:hypothetical protein